VSNYGAKSYLAFDKTKTNEFSNYAFFETPSYLQTNANYHYKFSAQTIVIDRTTRLDTFYVTAKIPGYDQGILFS
jgi:hypothetical protein